MTFAALKRRIVPGTRLTQIVQGGVPCTAPRTLTVVKVQTNAISLQDGAGKVGWSWWPKANQIQIEGATYSKLENGTVVAAYRIEPA